MPDGVTILEAILDLGRGQHLDVVNPLLEGVSVMLLKPQNFSRVLLKEVDAKPTLIGTPWGWAPPVDRFATLGGLGRLAALAEGSTADGTMNACGELRNIIGSL